MSTNYLLDAKSKKCQSKKNTSGGGCGDPRCPQGIAIANGLAHALKKNDYSLYEEISKIDKQHRTAKAVDALINQSVPEPAERFKAWELAPEGKSGWYCLDCGYDLTTDEAGMVDRGLDKCPQCSVKLKAETMGIKLLRSSIPLFDSAYAKKQTWFHATARADWLPSLQDMEDAPLTHLGSFNAAVTRGKDLRDDTHRQYGEEWYLYEVSIEPTAYFENKVFNDDDQKFPYYISDLEESSNRYGSGAIRYVNSFEEPGSVSLIINPQLLTVVKATRVHQDSLEELTTINA